MGGFLSGWDGFVWLAVLVFTMGERFTIGLGGLCVPGWMMEWVNGKRLVTSSLLFRSIFSSFYLTLAWFDILACYRNLGLHRAPIKSFRPS